MAEVKETEEKKVSAVCVATYPISNKVQALAMKKKLEEKNIKGATLKTEDKFIQVAIDVKSDAEAEKIIESVKAAGFTAFKCS